MMQKVYCMADQCELDHIYEYGLRYHYELPVWPYDRPRANAPIPFTLERTEDLTGISGTGTVADGVKWQDGTVTIRWRGKYASVTNFKTVSDMLHVHGHNGATKVKWY